MRQQAFRLIAMVLSVLLAVAAPARASSIGLADVVQVVVDGHHERAHTELSLRTTWQGGALFVSHDATQKGVQGGGGVGTIASSGKEGTATVTTVAVPSQGGPNIETIDLGEITGTVCDCGEIIIPPVGGGFPMWPLFALAAIPFFFLRGGKDGALFIPGPIPVPPTQTPTQMTPTPIPQPIPEPATLLLLGSGLLALGTEGRRRRRRRKDGVAINVGINDVKDATVAEEVRS